MRAGAMAESADATDLKSSVFSYQVLRYFPPSFVSICDDNLLGIIQISAEESSLLD